MTAQQKNVKDIKKDNDYIENSIQSPNSIKNLTKEFLKDFFEWWYVQMPVKYILMLRRVTLIINDKFSISILIKTFLIPWHRDTSFVGYLIGIIMRIIYLPIAITILLFSIGGYLAFILFWLFIPVTTLIMIFISPFIK